MKTISLNSIKITNEQYKAIQEILQSNEDQYIIEYKVKETCKITTISIGEGWNGENTINKEFGLYRHTKEAAEASLQRNKRTNRLAALVEDLTLKLTPGWEECWDGNTKNYSVHEDTYTDLWFKGTDMTYRQPELVYMSREVADEVCRLLDNNLYSL